MIRGRAKLNQTRAPAASPRFDAPPIAADTRLRPLAALAAVRRLIRNPDDTAQVFVVLQAMRGRVGLRLMRRFRRTPVGATVLRERRSLLAHLQDDAALARLPVGSLGNRYYAFMAAETLSADGLVASSQAIEPAPDVETAIFRDRMRDLHDLAHVLTGYGRDPLGELCLLAFNFAQSGHLGMAMIVLMGMTRFPKGRPGRRARAAVFEAWRHGHAAAWLGGQSWEAMLTQPTERLRSELRIAPPARYLAFAAPDYAASASEARAASTARAPSPTL